MIADCGLTTQSVIRNIATTLEEWSAVNPQSAIEFALRNHFLMPDSDGRSTVGLLRDLVGGGTHLVRQEVTLVRVEMTTAMRAIGGGTARVAAGGVLIVLGALAVFVGVILLVGDQWLRDRYWLAALIVALVVGGLSAFLVQRGRKALAPERLMPEQTVATLEEDKEWIKRRLTSGATSR
ncbi:MAG: phage holin family protein [Anaerolineae bacterium]|nr:phage holin family protein [Gemmatimonadaceae bacterium]